MVHVVATDISSISGDIRVKLLGFFLLGCGSVYPCLFAAYRLRRSLRLPPVFQFSVVLIVLGVFAQAAFFLTMIDTTGAKAFIWLCALAGVWTTTNAFRNERFSATTRAYRCVGPVCRNGALRHQLRGGSGPRLTGQRCHIDYDDDLAGVSRR